MSASPRRVPLPRRPKLGGGQLAIVAIAALLALAPVASAADFATVLQVTGPVDYLHSGAWHPAAVGTGLVPGDAVRTGESGFATVRDDRGAVTDLYPLTTLQITPDSQLSVTAGRIWSHFLHVLGVPRQIRTPDAVAMIRGTTLSVAVSSGQDAVTVLEGHVEVQSLAGGSRMVTTGFALNIDRGTLGPILQANPALLEQGRQFLERALLEGQSAAPQGHKDDTGRPGSFSGHLPDAEQRSDAEWDAHRFGAPAAADRRGGPEEHAVAAPDDRRLHSGRLRPNGAFGMGMMFRPGMVPPVLGTGDRTRNLSVERLERPSGSVGPDGVPLAGNPGTGGNGPPSTDPAAGQHPPLPGAGQPPPGAGRDGGSGSPPGPLQPISGQVEHGDSLSPPAATKESGAIGQK